MLHLDRRRGVLANGMGDASASSLLCGLHGDVLDPESLSAKLGWVGLKNVEIVEGTERRWPQSDSVKLRLTLHDEERLIFMKRVVVAPRPSTRRDLLSNRCEARFYREFVEPLKARGVPLLSALAVEERMECLDDDGTELPPGTQAGVLLLLESAEGFRQASPLSTHDARCALTSLARFHAATWEDTELLNRAVDRLHRTGGWWSV